MHTLTVHSNWQNHHQPQHWIKHCLIPVALICLALLLPKPWAISIFQPSLVIELELLESAQEVTEVPVEPVIESPQTEPITETIIEPPAPIEQAIEPTEKIIKQPPKPATHEEALSSPPVTVKPFIQPQISAGDVLHMIENRTSIDITPEFQARIGPATDFYIPKQEIQSWLDDIPYLDESVDKPQLQMRFYAEGFEGSIEKFFDKITISKTFTTKYGTKIHCALIGVIAACGWK